MNDDNRRIAKNTIYLYSRMIVMMLVTLYTSRIILEKLGVDDYGIYQAVGGIVGFLSFINGVLSTGTSRFLTFELGTGNMEKLKRTFSTLLTSHIILALFIVFLAETGGTWFIYNKMVIPPDRMSAAVYAFHLSIFAAFLSLTQVPYSAIIIAREKMNIYAYTSVFEVVAKLGICYLIGVGDFDRLMVYATMIFIVQMSLLLFYRFYCSRKFAEAKYQISLDKRILKPILSFSSWSMVAGISSTLSSQGILILLNMFFLPMIVSARAISLQVNNAAYQLVTNFRTAVNPQIVKLYAINDYQGSKKLLLQSTKYSYYLMLFMSLPMYFLADPLLYIWLGDNVPEYTTIFLQIAIVQSLFQVFDVSFYTALYAKGQLKENALISPMLNLLAFPVVYLLFENGFSPVALSWAYLIVYVLAGLLIKPLLIVKIVDYKWNEILSVFIRCFWVTVSAAIPSFFMNKLLDSSTVKGFVSELLLLVVIVVISIYTVGLDEIMRKKIQNFIWSKVKLC